MVLFQFHVEYDLNFISLPNVKALFQFRLLMFSSLKTRTSVAGLLCSCRCNIALYNMTIDDAYCYSNH